MESINSENKLIIQACPLPLLSPCHRRHSLTGDLAGRIIGGYQPIKDSYVVEIAKFAVSEHNKEVMKKLVFVKVVSGEKQVDEGINYKLHVDATTAGEGEDVLEAIVYDKPAEKSRSLISFKPIN
ncbi:hypothetical protein V2J09_012580 [Rumex salicifolius]